MSPEPRSLFYSLSTCLFLSTFLSLASTQKCVYPDGITEAPDKPCYGDGSTPSPCCNSESWCLENGWCIQGAGVSRGSCTDPNWGLPCAQNCVKDHDCPDNEGCSVWACGGDPWGFACNSVYNCGNNSFHDVTGNAIVLRPDEASNFGLGDERVTLSPTTTLLAQKQKGGNDTIITTTTVTASSNSSSHGYTSGDLAGASLGVGIPLLLALLGALFYIWKQRKTLKSIKSQKVSMGFPPPRSEEYVPIRGTEASGNDFPSGNDFSSGNNFSGGNNFLEMDTWQQRSEMEGYRRPGELQGYRNPGELQANGTVSRH